MDSTEVSHWFQKTSLTLLASFLVLTVSPAYARCSAKNLTGCAKKVVAAANSVNPVNQAMGYLNDLAAEIDAEYYYADSAADLHSVMVKTGYLNLNPRAVFKNGQNDVTHFATIHAALLYNQLATQAGYANLAAADAAATAYYGGVATSYAQRMAQESAPLLAAEVTPLANQLSATYAKVGQAAQTGYSAAAADGKMLLADGTSVLNALINTCKSASAGSVKNVEATGVAEYKALNSMTGEPAAALNRILRGLLNGRVPDAQSLADLTMVGRQIGMVKTTSGQQSNWGISVLAAANGFGLGSSFEVGLFMDQFPVNNQYGYALIASTAPTYSSTPGAQIASALSFGLGPASGQAGVVGSVGFDKEVSDGVTVSMSLSANVPAPTAGSFQGAAVQTFNNTISALCSIPQVTVALGAGFDENVNASLGYSVILTKGSFPAPVSLF